MSVKKFFYNLIESYITVLAIALFVGLYFADQVVVLGQYSTIFLGIIFFFTALKVDLKELKKYFSDIKMLFVVNIFMLLLLPVVVYYLTLSIYPSIAIALMLLAAMPSGMTSPLLAEIVGAKEGLALVFAITTSLLAPFTIPIVVKVLLGATVEVDAIAMFWSLVKVIFIPFVLANFIKHFWNTKIKATYYTFKPISIILLGLLIMGIVAQHSELLIASLQGQVAMTLIFLFGLFILLHVIGYFLIFWRTRKEQATISISLTYLNFTLAIFLAGEFFPDPAVLFPVILSILPWNVMIILYKFLTKKFKLV